MLWATRSRRCFSSATRSLSSNAGAGGVILMLDGIALSFFARTATPTGLSMARHANRASSANTTRVVFFISVLLKFSRKDFYVPFVAKVLVLAPGWPGGEAAAD